MSGDDLGRIEGSWREAEAEENAADLCDYLLRVMWRMNAMPELRDALERFAACTKGLDLGPVDHRDVQYLRRCLVRLELKGIVRRGLPDYELALDRLNAIERGSFSPLHRPWLFDASEIVELSRMASEFDPMPEFDFVSAVGIACSCNRPTAFLVIHDGTPTPEQLARTCMRNLRHQCESSRALRPLTIGKCHTDPGGIDAVIAKARMQIESRGIVVIGPYLIKQGELLYWPPLHGEVAS